ncbi:hypothetical protein H2248_001568 [Termitomyces sp. 'cryptogamus']|nr:hypothetical protein H2248_001568 [Termitomyces sp. 'cryptogamus']
MKERSSSNSNREDRMRSSTSRPYSNYSSSKEGRSSGKYKQEQMPSRRAKSVNMTSPFESLEEFRETPWMNIFKKESTYNGPEHRCVSFGYIGGQVSVVRSGCTTKYLHISRTCNKLLTRRGRASW